MFLGPETCRSGFFTCTLEILFFHNDGINFTANVESITNDVYMTLLEGIVDW